MFALACAYAHATETDSATVRPLYSQWTLEYGRESMTDTYLSPIEYRGNSYTLGHEAAEVLPWKNDAWVGMGQASFQYTDAYNPAYTARMLRLMLDSRYNILYRWELRPSLSVYAGPFAGIDLGVMYNARNSNNPADAIGAALLGATAMADWSISAWGIPVHFRGMLQMPLTGAFFRQQYGELYYEIYLGNRSGLVHAAWPGNYMWLNGVFKTEARLGSTLLSIGYHMRYASSKANDITINSMYNGLSLGIAHEIFSYNPKNSHKFKKARILSAYHCL